MPDELSLPPGPAPQADETPSPNASRSDSVNITASGSGDLTVGGDIVGRDKTEISTGGYVIRVEAGAPVIIGASGNGFSAFISRHDLSGSGDEPYRKTRPELPEGE